MATATPAETELPADHLRRRPHPRAPRPVAARAAAVAARPRARASSASGPASTSRAAGSRSSATCPTASGATSGSSTTWSCRPACCTRRSAGRRGAGQPARGLRGLPARHLRPGGAPRRHGRQPRRGVASTTRTRSPASPARASPSGPTRTSRWPPADLQRLDDRRVVRRRRPRPPDPAHPGPAVGPARWRPPRSGAARPRAATPSRSRRTRPSSASPRSTAATWDPLWEACSETDTVVTMHIGSSSSMPTTSDDAPLAVSMSLNAQNAAGLAVRLGVLRHAGALPEAQSSPTPRARSAGCRSCSSGWTASGTRTSAGSSWPSRRRRYVRGRGLRLHLRRPARPPQPRRDRHGAPPVRDRTTRTPTAPGRTPAPWPTACAPRPGMDATECAHAAAAQRDRLLWPRALRHRRLSCGSRTRPAPMGRPGSTCPTSAWWRAIVRLNLLVTRLPRRDHRGRGHRDRPTTSCSRVVRRSPAAPHVPDADLRGARPQHGRDDAHARPARVRRLDDAARPTPATGDGWSWSLTPAGLALSTQVNDALHAWERDLSLPPRRQGAMARGVDDLLELFETLA